MIDSYDEIKNITQDMYCITFRGVADGVSRLCYLMRLGKPLIFFKYEDAKKYFDMNEIDTCNDSLWFWRKGNLTYPDAKIVKFTLTNFEVI